MKYFSVLLLTLSFCLLFSCDSQDSSQLSVNALDRNAAFFDNYTEYVVIDIETAQEGLYVDVEYAQRHAKEHTKEVVDGMVAKLNKNKTVKAYANVFQKRVGGYQCVIVHRQAMSQSVMDHERGHCMKRILFEIIEKEFPDIYDNYLGDDKYGTYLSEGFAEVAAITRAYSLDTDFSYLNNRLTEIQGKASYQDGYKATLPLLLQARNYLINTEKLPENVEAQIRFVIEDFYLSKMLTRDEFETGRWWGWLK